MLKELDDLKDWSNRNGTKFYSAKCKVMNLETNKNFCYELGAHPLETIKEMKYLGVLVTHTMTMKCKYEPTV